MGLASLQLFTRVCWWKNGAKRWIMTSVDVLVLLRWQNPRHLLGVHGKPTKHKPRLVSFLLWNPLPMLTHTDTRTPNTAKPTETHPYCNPYSQVQCGHFWLCGRVCSSFTLHWSGRVLGSAVDIQTEEEGNLPDYWCFFAALKVLSCGRRLNRPIFLSSTVNLRKSLDLGWNFQLYILINATSTYFYFCYLDKRVLRVKPQRYKMV